MLINQSEGLKVCTKLTKSNEAIIQSLMMDLASNQPALNSSSFLFLLGCNIKQGY